MGRNKNTDRTDDPSPSQPIKYQPKAQTVHCLSPDTSRSEGAHCEREIEVEFRGLKQTIDKHKLRCRNNGRLLAELDWSLQGMAYAELLAMRAQIPKAETANEKFSPRDRSLAETLRVLRRYMRNLDQSAKPDALLNDLCDAVVQRYNNRTDKRARYRPKNPDIKPLGDPTIRKLTPEEKKKLRSHELKNAA